VCQIFDGLDDDAGEFIEKFVLIKLFKFNNRFSYSK
jgi:hypothetical protein